MSGFRDAIAGALATVRQVAGADVVYQRGAESVELRAGVGQTQLKQTTAQGLELQKTWRDYLIAVADLVLAGDLAKPARGDLIVDGPQTWQVVTIPGAADCYEVEPRGVGYRIHAQLFDDGTTE